MYGLISCVVICLASHFLVLFMLRFLFVFFVVVFARTPKRSVTSQKLRGILQKKERKKEDVLLKGTVDSRAWRLSPTEAE